MKFINFDDIVNKNNENYINKCICSSTCFKYNHNWANRMFKNKSIIQYFNIESSFSKNFYFYKRS